MIFLISSIKLEYASPIVCSWEDVIYEALEGLAKLKV